jgi:hypothetical protein
MDRKKCLQMGCNDFILKPFSYSCFVSSAVRSNVLLSDRFLNRQTRAVWASIKAQQEQRSELCTCLTVEASQLYVM